jgi:glycosyltransferase involved in cell wall biosynthesis
MHILFVHQAYPAQFGPVAEWMAGRKKHRVTFLSTEPSRWHGAIENIRYEAPADPKKGRTIPWSREFEVKMRHGQGVLRALKKRPDVRPDLVVGHSGFGSTLLIPETLDCPIVNYFEYFMHPRRNDILDRKDLSPPPDWFGSWRRTTNAVFLLDLENCRVGYSPMHWQRNLLPQRYRSKVKVFFDGIDTRVFRPLRQRAVSRALGKSMLPRGVRVVSYVARGLEAIRGFDIFMKVAKRIYREYPNVVFVVAGRERAAYASDVQSSGAPTFKKWTLRQDSYDLSKFRFVGWLPTPDLVQLFNLTDLHIYLTTPFPLSWSLFNAMACGATVLASNTAPVCELVAHGRNALLVDFFEVDALAEQAIKVLRAPADYREFGTNAAEHIRENYSIDVTAPRLLEFFEQNANGRRR